MTAYDTFQQEVARIIVDEATRDYAMTLTIAQLRYPRLPLADLFGYARDHMTVVGWQLVRAVMQDVQTRRADDKRTMMRVTV